MVDVATFLGADADVARAEMLEVLLFEMQLANISLPREERRNATRYSSVTLYHVMVPLNVISSPLTPPRKPLEPGITTHPNTN